jgi:hypothetical protein
MNDWGQFNLKKALVHNCGECRITEKLLTEYFSNSTSYRRRFDKLSRTLEKSMFFVCSESQSAGIKENALEHH